MAQSRTEEKPAEKVKLYVHPLQDRSQFFYGLILPWSSSMSPHDSKSPPPLQKLETGHRSRFYHIRSTHKIKGKTEVRGMILEPLKNIDGERSGGKHSEGSEWKGCEFECSLGYRVKSCQNHGHMYTSIHHPLSTSEKTKTVRYLHASQMRCTKGILK